MPTAKKVRKDMGPGQLLEFIAVYTVVSILQNLRLAASPKIKLPGDPRPRPLQVELGAPIGAQG